MRGGKGAGGEGERGKARKVKGGEMEAR
jgi:hypothetical protein